MKTQKLSTEVNFSLPIGNIPEKIRLEAEKKAKEAYVMTLLRHADISAGRAAELLECDRASLSELMSTYNISPFATLTREELEREVNQTLRTLEDYKK